jgi:hypothetical protein
VYVRKRISRRRSFYKKHRVLIIFLACAGTFLFAFALANILRRPVVKARLKPVVLNDAPELMPKYQPVEYERFVYPYSVIPGGVRSREELVLKMEEDPVVAAHFSGFGTNRAKIVRSEEAQFVHVSYRIRNKVYWTAKTVKIPRGETLITDGQDSARTRCGNKVSVLPQEPISEVEPPVETFDIPIVASAEAPALDLVKLPEPDLEWKPDIPLIPPMAVRHPQILPYYYRPLFAVNPTDIAVPEPGTLCLLATGLAATLAFRFARKYK